MKRLFRRADPTQRTPLDPQRRAAIRRSLVWVPISYVPLVGGLAWAFFAAGHWTGTRAVFLAVSGVMIGVAASSALYLPVLRVTSPNRRLLGMSLTRYSYISIVLALAIAAVLAVAAIAIPHI